MAGELEPWTNDRSISGALLRQYQRAFHTLRDAIAQLDDQQWRFCEVDWLIPARQVFHAINSVDFYSRPAPVSGLGKRFGDWEESPATELPPRSAMLDYLFEMEEGVREWLTPMTDEQLLAPETNFKWTGTSVLDRALYCLRHLQHHVAIVNSELRRRGLPRGQWQ